MQYFTINENLEVKAEVYKTRYSWGHKAWLYRGGELIDYKKITYYNRTWERYTFESILECLAGSKELTPEERAIFKNKIENQFAAEDPELKNLKTVAAIASLGEFFAPDQKGANDWKARMLKAGLSGKGLIMPEDWDELSEAEKEARLNAAIKAIS